MATYYIDPDVTAGGVGTELDPFKLWSESTFAAGNTYLQKRGTSALEKVIVGVTGTAGNIITLGAYGTGADPIIDGEATRVSCLEIDSVSYIDVSDFRFTGGTIKGLHIKGDFFFGCDYINITDCVADNIPGSADAICNGVGMAVDNLNITTRPCNYITFTRCISHTCGRMGFDTQTGGTDIKWINCIAYNNGATYDGGGFFAHPYRVTQTSGWSVVSGDIYTIGSIGANDDVGNVYNSTDFEFLTKTTSPTPAAGEYYYNKGVELRVNLGVGIDPNTKTISYARYTQTNFSWIGCTAHSNKSEPGNTHGSGIQVDDLISNSTVERCTSYNNEGNGIMLFQGENNTVSGCVVYGNSSVTNDGIQSYQQANSTIANCLVYDNDGDGIAIGTGDTTVSGCIVTNNTRYGILVIIGTANTNNNCTYGNTVGHKGTESGGTLNETDNITTDPQLDANNAPASTSPCVGTGVKWWTGANPVGIDGEPFADFETDIGAVQGKWSSFHPTRLLR